ncbi:hypothetical protein E3U43_004589 [Larimichthys crocea]|uniref:Uncharacterized protein n=1 Tax=Larimichthys crocea TaxID=215358 RepID=A0ACD3QE32_LARCR|nr:hypothetical protein E3U43_004589 [Larimichthys crocea]
MSLRPASGLLRSALRSHLVPVANWSGKPAKHNIGGGEQAIAMTVPVCGHPGSFWLGAGSPGGL